MGALEDECIAIGEAFEAATGIETEVVVLGGGEILARVEAESENPIASVWWGGGIDGQMNAKDRGLLTPYFSPNREAVDEKLKDPDGYWTGVYTGYVGFVYNIARRRSWGMMSPLPGMTCLIRSSKARSSLLLPTLRLPVITSCPRFASFGM